MNSEREGIMQRRMSRMEFLELGVLGVGVLGVGNSVREQLRAVRAEHEVESISEQLDGIDARRHFAGEITNNVSVPKPTLEEESLLHAQRDEGTKVEQAKLNSTMSFILAIPAYTMLILQGMKDSIGNK